MSDRDASRVRIPADFERPYKLLGASSAATRHVVPFGVFAAVAVRSRGWRR